MRKTVNALVLFAVTFLGSCSVATLPNENSEFIHAVQTRNELYLQGYKESRELNWNADWKLMDTRIDVHETKTEQDDKIVTVSKDTSCILEWNLSYGDKGIIRREVYENAKDWPTMECFYYEKDSIYARGTIEYIMTGRHEKLVITENISPKYVCSNCSSKSYNDAQQVYFNDTISHFTTGYEYDFYDSRGLLSGAYACPKFAIWNYKYKNGNSDYTATLTSDTTIDTKRNADFVTLYENQ